MNNAFRMIAILALSVQRSRHERENQPLWQMAAIMIVWSLRSLELCRRKPTPDSPFKSTLPHRFIQHSFQSWNHTHSQHTYFKYMMIFLTNCRDTCKPRFMENTSYTDRLALCCHLAVLSNTLAYRPDLNS